MYKTRNRLLISTNLIHSVQNIFKYVICLNLCIHFQLVRNIIPWDTKIIHPDFQVQKQFNLIQCSTYLDASTVSQPILKNSILLGQDKYINVTGQQLKKSAQYETHSHLLTRYNQKCRSNLTCHSSCSYEWPRDSIFKLRYINCPNLCTISIPQP